jgi:hypothetical protein
MNRHPDVSYKEFTITRFRNLNLYKFKILVCWHTNWRFLQMNFMTNYQGYCIDNNTTLRKEFTSSLNVEEP